MKRRLFSALEVKSVYGRPLNGAMLASLAGEYVTALNESGTPTISTAWERVVAAQCEVRAAPLVVSMSAPWSLVTLVCVRVTCCSVLWRKVSLPTPRACARHYTPVMEPVLAQGRPVWVVALALAVVAQLLWTSPRCCCCTAHMPVLHDRHSTV